MSISPADTHNREARAVHVRVDADRLTVDLDDGRIVSAPVTWFPLLYRGSIEQRNRWQLMADGCGIHWPELDEDISVEGLLKGQRAPDHWWEMFGIPRPAAA